MSIRLAQNRWIALALRASRGALRAVRTVCGAVLMMCGLVATSAYAQTATCIPFGFGGAYAPGPPQWFSGPVTSGFGRFNTWVDDPRWSGAASITYGDGVAPEMQFRALYNPLSGSPQYVYMSFWHKAAIVGAPATNNRLYIGLAPSMGAPGLLLEVDLATATPSTASFPAATIKVYPVDANGTVGNQFPSAPTWTNDLRVWIDQVTDQTTLIPASATNAAEPNNWAVHLRIPIGQNLAGGAPASITLGANFNMWFELLQGTPGAPLIAYTWPRSTAQSSFYLTDDPVTGTKVPMTMSWPQFTLGNNVNVSCPGITFDASDIGVTYQGSPDTSSIAKTLTNTFTATPTNKSGGPVDVDAIKARFRIAAWGIQPSTGDANPGTANWMDIRGLGAVQMQQTVPPAPPAQIANTAKWTLSGNWLNNNSAQEAALFNGTDSPHECVQVELSGGSLTFLQSSAFTNMRTVPASRFTDNAVVSLISMPNASTPNRDVYLYVETVNMPAVFTSGGETPRGSDVVPQRAVVAQPAPENFTARAAVAGTGASGDEVEEAARVYDLTAYERAKAVAPTYIVHGYYDTGTRLTVNGMQRPILAPMVSFGYFVDHKGPLFGWSTALGGAQQIAPFFYLLHVPNNSAVPISVSIEALEQLGGGPSFGELMEWLQWLLIILMLVALLLLLVRRWRLSHP